MIKSVSYIALFILLGSSSALAQYRVSGLVTTDEGLNENATVILDQGEFVDTTSEGFFSFENVKSGKHSITAFLSGYETQTIVITVENSNLKVKMALSELSTNLNEVIIQSQKDNSFGITRLKSIDGTGIYEAKKTEVIILEDMVANKAANNARQVFAKIPGANIWESDCAGLQIGIATRGLSPNRNSNFNTRQNGFDISADALGYPESYYTPPIQAVEKIELVRGAASLQYGTQFGGLVNFVIKNPPKDKLIELTTEQTYNSLGFYNGYVDVGMSLGKLSFFFFNKITSGDCWRCNTQFAANTSYLDIHYQFSDAFKMGLELTRMNYLSQQPGGLTDNQFYENAKQSNRERNWFQVDWNLISVHLDYAFSSNLRLNSRTFSLLGSKDALGNLGRIDRVDDPNEERDLLSDEFRNWGNETRLIYNYHLGKEQSAFLIGSRFYKGFTHRQQGLGSAGDSHSFKYINPKSLEGSDFDLPGTNVAFFIENIFNISPKFSVTPGARFEYINTEADGYYRNTTSDLAGNILTDTLINESISKKRSFVFGGIGMSYKMNPNVEFYGNYSQNYRSINFNDIRVNNPSLKVDENIQDEFGGNFDLGSRGNIKGFFNYDISLFLLKYNDRIGTILVSEPDPRFNNLIDRTYRLRTNIGDAHTYGIEIFAEANLFKVINPATVTENNLSIFLNLALINSQYLRSAEAGVTGNEVELVPKYNFKTGLSYQSAMFSSTLQFSTLAKQFSDASNANEPAPGAVEGLIPAYSIVDLSAEYKIGKGFYLQGGVNNLTDARYFTRRAAGYPGPGILPSDGRSFYFTVGYSFDKLQ
ncbi:MAG: Fe(3+) dicitrate transport protein [Cyclobacteriaceae bacterium]